MARQPVVPQQQVGLSQTTWFRVRGRRWNSNNLHHALMALRPWPGPEHPCALTSSSVADMAVLSFPLLQLMMQSPLSFRANSEVRLRMAPFFFPVTPMAA